MINFTLLEFAGGIFSLSPSLKSKVMLFLEMNDF
jgi:hypothetical protein